MLYLFLVLICVTRPCNAPGMLRRDISRRFIIIIIIIIITIVPVSTWMGDRLRAGIPSRYVTSQLDQLSLVSIRGRLIEYQLQLG